MIFRLFRAPDLAFWTLAVVVLGVLAVVASSLGHDPVRAASAPGAAVVVSATRSAASTPARDLLALMPAGIAAGTDPAGLTAWAQEIDTHARVGLAIRQGEGADAADALTGEFTQLSTQAASLQTVASQPVAATSLRIQIGLHVSRVMALVTGAPAPVLPAGPTGLFHTTTPAVPAAPAPATPAIPALPQSLEKTS